MKKPNETILTRFEEIAPDINIDGLTIPSLETHVMIGFKIIGYTPNNLSDSVYKAWDKMDGEGELYRFCYNCWRFD